jgi:hypothetical protein
MTAAESTKHTCSIDNLLKKNRSKPVALATNYMDLKLNIGTYCGLLWLLFGDHCDYYKELLKFTVSWTAKNASQSGTRTPRRCVQESLGQSSITDAPSSDGTLSPLISRQDRLSNSRHHILKGSRMLFATPSQSNEQLSHGSGLHNQHPPLWHLEYHPPARHPPSGPYLPQQTSLPPPREQQRHTRQEKMHAPQKSSY